MKIAILKYNAGNTFSLSMALQRLGVRSQVTDNREEILAADKIIFPGVGEASSAMQYLRENGLAELLPQLKQPFLGICLGMQLMCAHSEENDTECLNIFPVQVKIIPPKEKVPHMGWNQIKFLSGELFTGIPDGRYVYFVHSYFAGRNQYETAVTDYVIPFSASLQKDNFYALQFHPEKSAAVGEKILRNFIEL